YHGCGSANINYKLSDNRQNLLWMVSLQRDRFIMDGYGETKSITNRDTNGGRKLNRRVAFQISQN
ncbi:MAG: hypothetical protein M3R50_03610, partial [Bacteroidota bacterium]|nr:hypothetical protein [Bacteroidota bacterium]